MRDLVGGVGLFNNRWSHEIPVLVRRICQAIASGENDSASSSRPFNSIDHVLQLGSVDNRPIVVFFSAADPERCRSLEQSRLKCLIHLLENNDSTAGCTTLPRVAEG